MNRANADEKVLTYPLRTAARLTGLSPELLRAWEGRHGVVQPLRTPGGTRRYTAADLERLRLVKAAVDAGQRISQVAGLDLAELERRAAGSESRPTDRIDEILSKLDDLDGPASHRLLSTQLSTLGPARFAQDLAIPLVREIGERWASGRIGIAQEHLATAVLRSLLGAALQPTTASLLGPRIVFATPSAEPHELGLLMAALTALGAGANPIYLGPEVPIEDLLGAVEQADAAVLALSLVTVPKAQATRAVRALRAGIAESVALWLGGSGAGAVQPPTGVEQIATLDDLERRVVLLGLATASRS